METAQGWSEIFHYFNRTHDRGNAGYKAGEKIGIKANQNNTTDHGTIDRLNSSPSLILRSSGSYSAFADFLGHKDLSEKIVLFIIDGLYGNDTMDGPPHRKWKMAPFNDAWPNSIFMSLDGVALASVGFNF